MANQKFATYFLPSFPRKRESTGLKINGFRLAPGFAGLTGMTAIYATNLRHTILVMLLYQLARWDD